MAMIIGLYITDMLPASPDFLMNENTITDSHWIINTLPAGAALYHRVLQVICSFQYIFLAHRQLDEAHG
jgi:hypothetical protein